MKMKKMVSAALALCLALTLSVPAFADDEDEGELYDDPWSEPTDEAQSELENDPEPDEEVTAPVEEETTTDETVVEENTEVPDEVPVEDETEIPDEVLVEDDLALEITETTSVPAATSLEDEDLIEVSVPASGQILLDPYGLAKDSDGTQLSHDPQALVNHSGFPVTVNVQLTGTVPAESEAVLVDDYPAADCQEKEVFAYVEFSTDPDSWADTYTGTENQLVALSNGVYREDVMTLDADGEGYFRFSGAMATGASWEETDTFGAILVFSFEPVYTDEEPTMAEFLPEEVSQEETSLAESITPIDVEPLDDADLPDNEDSSDDAELPVDEDPLDEADLPVDEDPVEDTEPITGPSPSEGSTGSGNDVEDEGSSPENLIESETDVAAGT